MSTRASWVPSADGLAHLPMLQGPGMLVTGCLRSLPEAAAHPGVVPEGQRRCPECFMALLSPPDLVPQTPAGRRLNRSCFLSPDSRRPAGPSTPAAGEDMTVPEPDPGGCPWSSNRYSQSFLERVAEEVRVRSMLRDLIALAEHASVLTDPQIRSQLIALAGTARSGCRERDGADRALAAHRLRGTPGGQPVPEDPATGAGTTR